MWSTSINVFICIIWFKPLNNFCPNPDDEWYFEDLCWDHENRFKKKQVELGLKMSVSGGKKKP